jgi:hypothetical protein
MKSVHLVERFKRAGWGDALLAALDLIEPVGIVGAQFLYIVQPMARLMGDRQGEISTLAGLLETPEGFATLRQMLESEDKDTAQSREEAKTQRSIEQAADELEPR